MRRGYAPTVSRIKGQEQDFQTYEDTEGHTGGILVNHIRYSWNEFWLADNIEINSSNKEVFKESGTKTITFDTGERLELKWTAGDTIENITRVNRWEADSEGITINGNTAEKIKWDEVEGISGGTVTGSSITFEYHGAQLSVSVEDGDTIEDLIDGINGDDFSEDVYWITEAAGTSSSRAVQIKSINVNGSTATSWALNADDEGVWLTTDSGVTDTKIAWSNFQDISTGNYPMSDFGTSAEETDSVTLDNTATYKYVGDNSGFSMTFSVADAASKASIINSLDGLTWTSTLSDAVFSSSHEDGKGTATVKTSSLSSAVQDYLGGPIDGDGTEDSFIVSDLYNQHTEMLYIYVYGKNSYYNTNAEYVKYSKGVTYSTTLERDKVTRSQTLLLTLTDTSKNDLEENGATEEDLQSTLEVKIDCSKMHYSAYNSAYWDFIGIFDANCGESANYRYKYESAYVDYKSSGGSNSYPSSTIYDYKTIGAQRQLDIQAGFEAGQHIHMEWDALSLGTLSMGGLSLATADEAEAAIGTVKNAMQIISRQRSNFGAMQNRMEHTIANLDNVVENTTAAESQIRDTDMAKEMVAYSNANILAQADQTILAQTNQQQQSILSLLQ